MTAAAVALVLDPANAEQLDNRIRQLSATIADNLNDLAELIDQAKAGKIHLTLGYPSWTAYLTDALGTALHGVRGDVRLELVRYLSREGMSQRAIASVVAAGVGTVNRDLAAGVPDGTPEAAGATAVPPTTTGLDGKTYQRPPQKPTRRRRPITDAYRDHVRTIARNVDALARLGADDRFARNRDTIRGMDRGALIRARDALDRVIQQLGENA